MNRYDVYSVGMVSTRHQRGAMRAVVSKGPFTVNVEQVSDPTIAHPTDALSKIALP